MDTLAENDEDKTAEVHEHQVGDVLQTQVLYQLEILDDNGWRPMGAVKADRDELTMIQSFHAKKHPEDRRRVVRITTTIEVEEIEGNGPGQTSYEEIWARNEKITERLLGRD